MRCTLSLTADSELLFSHRNESDASEEEQDRLTELILDWKISVVLIFAFTLDICAVGENYRIITDAYAAVVKIRQATVLYKFIVMI